MYNTESGNRFVLSTMEIQDDFKDSDDMSSSSPSRSSESVQLLHRRKFSHQQSNLTFFICIILIILFLIVGLFLTVAFFHVLNQQNDQGDRSKFWDHSLMEDNVGLNSISRQLAAEIDSNKLKHNLELFSKHAHLAGTKEQQKLMHVLAEKYANFGFSVKVYNYTVLLNYPETSVPNVVELQNDDGNWETLSKGRGTPLGPKEALNEQQDKNSQLWWNAYSANGTVEGQIVYCNYGTKDDYDKLGRMGVEVKGRIGLIRYGALKRFEKVRLAQIRGMIGVLLFSDPIHYTTRNRSNVFPESIYLPGDDVQRGSVMATHGDPLTPLLPSTIYTAREETEESARRKGVLPKIPVTPIGYNDAKKIMDLMDGDPAPSFEWSGGLDSVYRLTGEKVFRLSVHSKFAHRIITNVIATLKGSEEPDRWVLVGNHVDAWGNGAIDPISGTSTQLEMARVMSKIFKENPPKRSIVFCHWDAEEFGLIGSTEWVEEMQHILHRRAVAYINVDHISGNITPDVRSVPLLYRSIVKAAKKTRQKNLVEQKMGRNRLFDSWRYYRGKGPIFGDRGVPEIGLPTSGSDYQRFIAFLGIPSADLKMENKPGSSYPLYHTMYETNWMVRNLMDSELESFSMMANFWLELTHRLANSLIIPFDVIDYTTVINTLVHKAEAHLNHLNITRVMPTVTDQLFLLKEALKRLHEVSRDFQMIITDVQTGAKLLKRVEVETINNRLQELERCFIDWTMGQNLNRHLIFSASQYHSHLPFLAAIQDNAKDISLLRKEIDKKRLSLSFSKLHLAVESAIRTLTI